MFLPNLFIAGVIIFVGYILANIVRGIVEGLLRSLDVQSQVQKIGLFKTGNLPHLLGSFVFTLIIITALIIAFEALGIEAISRPATAMLSEIMNAIPQIIAAGLILVIAYVVSRFVARLVSELVAGTGVDEDEDAEDEVDTGPDPELAREKFSELRAQYEVTRKSINENGREHPQTKVEIDKLSEVFRCFRLVPKQFDRLVKNMREMMDRVRVQERIVMKHCVEYAKMPKKNFLKAFTGHENSSAWIDIVTGKQIGRAHV